MEKKYSYDELRAVRDDYNDSLFIVQTQGGDHAQLLRKRTKRIVWAIILILVSIAFLFITIKGEGQGLTFGQMLESAKNQLLSYTDANMGTDDRNILGGLLCSGICLIIGICQILGAISAGKKAGRLGAQIYRAKQVLREVEETYAYKGKNWDITNLRDDPKEMTALEQDVKDLFAALFLFRDDPKVYHKNWLSKLGLDEASRLLEAVNKEGRGNNPGSVLMCEGKHTTWYVQVASLATIPIMTAVSMYGFAFDQKVDFDGTELFMAAYSKNTNVDHSKEDKGFLAVVNDVQTYLPAKLAELVQSNIRQKLGC